jgi:hypothetical protein
MPVAFYEDTDPKALEFFLELHRRMTPEERVARIFEMVAFMEGLQRSSVCSMHPEADEREIFLRVAARRLGRDIMLQVYGWDPELRGW